ncbi:MAG: hypothetical protein HZA14_00505 [Nitrospirae bacterium]|nr:hypothetical protein [Nitrospirota bacterium]
MRRQPLQCPFCESCPASPVDIDLKSVEIIGGICECGAVYALDRTGHNLGEIFMDALTFLCKGDIDMALSLMPDDYETETLDYDIHTNTISSRPEVSRRSSKLVFIRMKRGNTKSILYKR